MINRNTARYDTNVRRILVSEAGRRVQEFLSKLEITRTYVSFNSYLYSVYGSVRAKTRKNPTLINYRNRWVEALSID
ncbi:hypothetical protein YTPLAS72_06850 [Nitrospira sp.]|nr:hypothetical protein YTPLAS72_06850 [Nitrospira sp.]